MTAMTAMTDLRCVACDHILDDHRHYGCVGLACTCREYVWSADGLRVLVEELGRAIAQRVDALEQRLDKLERRRAV